MIKDELEIIKIFFYVDEFCKQFIPVWNKYLIGNREIKRIRKDVLSYSEIITILILYHNSKTKNFKEFYNNWLYNKLLKNYFPNIPCYDRFLVLQRKAVIPLLSFIQYLKGKETGIYYIDSTSLSVCKNQRIGKHKTFKNIAKRGKSSMGWFFGFKLHLVINNQGEIMNFKITKGNICDNVPVLELVKHLSGKLFGDRGYITKKDKLKQLKENGIDLFYNVRSNMKNKPNLSKENKCLLAKRSMIETVFGKVKDSTNICITKIKNHCNYLINILSSIASYIINFKEIILRQNIDIDIEKLSNNLLII